VATTSTASKLTDLYGDGTLEKIYRALKGQVPSASMHEIQDAVGHAVVATLRAHESKPPDDLVAYLFTAAKRQLKREIDARGRLPAIAVDAETGPEDPSRPEDAFDCRDLFNFLKRLVAKWDNQRMRTVVEIVLDAALEDVSMTGQELAEQAEAITGEPFSLSSVYDWKARGLLKLRDELEQSLGQVKEGP